MLEITDTTVFLKVLPSLTMKKIWHIYTPLGTVRIVSPGDTHYSQQWTATLTAKYPVNVSAIQLSPTHNDHRLAACLGRYTRRQLQADHPTVEKHDRRRQPGASGLTLTLKTLKTF
jgi:hypothetical protein